MAAYCPLPHADGERVLLAHGGGGRLGRQLIETLLLPAYGAAAGSAAHDGALLAGGTERLAFTTDSYVVRPLFFPGGDIGRLAVFGTVNDLAMCGARPQALSVAMILEEGLELSTLRAIARSMGEAALACEVRLVTGDTKVVERGHGDGLYINTAGIGRVPGGVDVGPHRLAVDDVLILSGDVGRHGVAVMAAREGLAFETHIESDLGALHTPVAALLEAGLRPHCLRDLTRGGLATAAVELASAAALCLCLDDCAIAVDEAVYGACELLGLDPLYVANEGRMLLAVPPEQAEASLALLRAHAVTGGARVVGAVTAGAPGCAVLRTAFGTERVLDMLSGEQLPRIC